MALLMGDSDLASDRPDSVQILDETPSACANSASRRRLAGLWPFSMVAMKETGVPFRSRAALRDRAAGRLARSYPLNLAGYSKAGLVMMANSFAS